jgi:hypothetical protein
MVVILLFLLKKARSVDRNRPRLVALGARQIQGEDPIRVLRLDATRIEPHRKRPGAIEFANDALTSMHAHAVGEGDDFLARNTNGVLFGLDLQIALIDARQLDDGKQILALLKYVDRREGSAAGRRVLKPVARQLGFECSLEAKQRFKRIGKC